MLFDYSIIKYASAGARNYLIINYMTGLLDHLQLRPSCHHTNS